MPDFEWIVHEYQCDCPDYRLTIDYLVHRDMMNLHHVYFCPECDKNKHSFKAKIIFRIMWKLLHRGRTYECDK